MKPMGAIPADFRAEGASLLIGGRSVDDLIAEAGGTPLFVYDFGIVARRIARFRGAFPSVQLHYAIKANPYIPLLKFIFKTVNGLDVASAGELRMALGAGANARHLSFAGPGTRDLELETAIRAGITLNAEPEGEWRLAMRIAAPPDTGKGAGGEKGGTYR